MKKYSSKIFLVLMIMMQTFSNSSCQENERNSLLSKYDFKSKENISFILDKSLNEISGLCNAGNNFAFTHNDEQAIIYKIDLKTGKIILKFSLGKEPVKDDFEGIAIVDDNIYLITSDAVLYKFREGENDESVEYEIIETGLKKGYDIEGLCYDPERNSLLLACKDIAKKKYKRYRLVFEFDLEKNELIAEPLFKISLKDLADEFNISEFAPSGIEQHPLNGDFFIISANEPSIIEISKEGKLVDGVKLKDKDHRQTEGITILEDNTIVLSDEADNKKAKLTIIKMK